MNSRLQTYSVLLDAALKEIESNMKSNYVQSQTIMFHRLFKSVTKSLSVYSKGSLNHIRKSISICQTRLLMTT